MTVASAETTSQRPPLTRQRILQAALRYIDTYGLSGLSMHKLGAELGIKGMSLYNYVANKRDLLDGVVELLWEEVDDVAPETDWREGYRSFARALRDAVHRHPNAAGLITSQQIIPEHALRSVRAHITVATESGVAQARAYAVLRTVTSYALGTALNEVAWGAGRATCAPTTVADLLRPGTPRDLAGVAEIFCGQSDPDAEFELGLDLMFRGLEDLSHNP